MISDSNDANYLIEALNKAGVQINILDNVFNCHMRMCNLDIYFKIELTYMDSSRVYLIDVNGNIISQILQFNAILNLPSKLSNLLTPLLPNDYMTVRTFEIQLLTALRIATTHKQVNVFH